MVLALRGNVERWRLNATCWVASLHVVLPLSKWSRHIVKMSTRALQLTQKSYITTLYEFSTYSSCDSCSILYFIVPIIIIMHFLNYSLKEERKKIYRFAPDISES